MLFPPPPNSLLAVPPPSMGLPDLPRPLDTDRPIHWHGDDGQCVFVEVQGTFAAVAVRKGPLSYVPNKRQEIKGFSASSRLRLFKITNRLDFAKAGRSTFVTATWRDELGRPDPKEITSVRSSFQKSLERLAGKKLPGLWRIEWEVRKKGRFKGEYMPHCHAIYFCIPYLPIKDVERLWARSIGWAGPVSFKMAEIDNLRKCLIYVSKYIAKLDVLCRLDIPSYLAKHLGGRKWGVYRRKMLPLAEQTLIRVAPGPLIEEIRRLATAAYAKTPQDADAGFCVFGSAAEEIAKKIKEWELTHVEGLVR